MKKKILIIICVTTFGSLFAEEIGGRSSSSWKDGPLESEFMLNQELLQGNVNTLTYMDKRQFDGDTFNEAGKRIVSQSPHEISLRSRLVTRTLPSHMFQQHTSCSCETQFEIKDLGEGHYPRYLTESRCKLKGCQHKFNPCRLLHYMVHVLKQRTGLDETVNEDSGVFPESPLPESLQQNWRLLPMSVAVACVPTTHVNVQRND